MTAKELRLTLEALPDEQHICFGLINLQDANDRIGAHLSVGNKSISLDVAGYERCNVGQEEDDLFCIDLYVVD